MNVTFDRPGWSYEILKALHVFHQQEEYCDVVVVCNDKKIRAHSCVLAAASPWVASELQCGSSEGPVQIVSLEDTPSQVVQYIMTFVYTGQFKVPLKHMKEVQALAGRLRIKCMDDDEEEGGEAEDTPQDYEVPVPDSSLPSDTVVTLNTDWNEADSTPSASQSDSKPSVSHSHRPPAASPARHAGPSHSQGSVPTSPPIYSRPVSLKRSVQDPQSDIPGKNDISALADHGRTGSTHRTRRTRRTRRTYACVGKKPSKRSRYTVEYKCSAIDWYLEHGHNIRGTAREFGVDKSSIREWVVKEHVLRALNIGESKDRLEIPKHPKLSLINQSDWVRDQRDTGRVVTNEMLITKVKEEAQACHIPADQFVASEGAEMEGHITADQFLASEGAEMEGHIPADQFLASEGAEVEGSL